MCGQNCGLAQAEDRLLTRTRGSDPAGKSLWPSAGAKFLRTGRRAVGPGDGEADSALALDLNE
jgi:hypothetical protein